MSNPRRASTDCLAVLLATAAVAVALTWPAPDIVKANVSQGSMVLFGSSSVNGRFGHLIEDDFSRLGFQVARYGYSAAGLARPDFLDLHLTLEKHPIDKTTKSVLLYIGGNDAQSIWLRPAERPGKGDDEAWVHWNDARWSSIYENRAIKLIRSVCSRGAKHVIVLPPADVTSARLQTRLDRVRPLLQRAAKATDCGRFVSTAGDRGRFFIDGEPLRAVDGVHMTRSGAQRVWNRVRETVIALARN
jgi:hypothetical protein